MSRYSLLLLACALAVASCFVANGAPLRGERLHQADSPLCMVSVARCGGLRRLQKKSSSFCTRRTSLFASILFLTPVFSVFF